MRKIKLIATIAGISFAAMSFSSIAADEKVVLDGVKSADEKKVVLDDTADKKKASPDGAKLYKEKTCTACHGKDAKTPLLDNYPKLAGQNKDYTVTQMQDIKSGARNNGQTAAMKGVMHLVSEEEIVAIAEWLASLK